MNNLNKHMQERLDRWKKNTITVPSTQKLQGATNKCGKGDYGDVNSLEELEEEHRKSQTRR